MKLEIRTPMNGICASTELLLDTPQTERNRELISLVKKSADLMMVLINVRMNYKTIFNLLLLYYYRTFWNTLKLKLEK
jgi:hypothetical protein